MQLANKTIELFLPSVRGNDITFESKMKQIQEYLPFGSGEVKSQFGTTSHRQINDRQYVIHFPIDFQLRKQRGETFHLLVFLHGSRGYCWYHALMITRWIQLSSKYGLIILFGQAIGAPAEAPFIHQKFIDKGVSFGERYWEIRDAKKQFHADIQYIKDIVEEVQTKVIKIKGNKFLAGQSNGGVFSCLAAIYLKDVFDGFYSSMGGIGHDINCMFDFDKQPENSKPGRLFLYTGSLDVHNQPTRIAEKIFKDNNYQVELIDQLNIKHAYQYKVEQKVIKWLLMDENKE